jgi:hypothetical protein
LSFLTINNCYIFGIPIAALILDFVMRLIISAIANESMGFLDICYGPDLSLTGLVTALAGYHCYKNSNPMLPYVVLTASAILFLSTMYMQGKAIRNRKMADNRWGVFGWSAGLISLNLYGCGQMMLVLYLMYVLG